MNKILYFLILIISNNVFSQKNLFENLTIDKNTKIIGRYPQYDKTKTYEKYNFILEDSLEISNFINSIKLGEEVPNSIEEPCFPMNSTNLELSTVVSKNPAKESAVENL